MKRIFLATLCAASLLTFSCNPKDSKDKDKDDDKETVKKKSLDEDEETKDEDVKDYSKAATGICNCMGDMLDGLSSKSKRIIKKAADSDDPQQVMKDELGAIEDEAEKQKVATEFQKFGTAIQDETFTNCAQKVEKKYNVDDKNKQDQKLLFKKLEEDENCDILSALYKIGTKAQQKTTE